jgi:hypothetical protein
MSELFPHALPLQGFLGGTLIGFAAAIMLLGLGRIAGVSGLVARASGIANSGAPRSVATAFILGLPLGAWLMGQIGHIQAAQFPAAIWPLLLGGAFDRSLR